MRIAEVMQFVNVALAASYPFAGVASLAAVTIVLWRLGHGWMMVFAPVLATILFAGALQVLVAIVYDLPFFAFGFRGAFMPALALVPPVAMALIAFSPRLRR